MQLNPGTNQDPAPSSGAPASDAPPSDAPPAPAPSAPAAGGSSPVPSGGTSVSDVLGAAFTELPPDLASQISSWATSYMQQNPGASSDAFMATLVEQPFYKNFFAGNQTLIAQGKTPLSPADYLNYMQSAQQLAHVAGLPEGFLSKQEVDTLIGNSVSITELNDRVNNAYLATNEIMSANPDVAKYLTQNYGVTQGGLLAYVMDPNKALPVIEQNLAAGVVGGAGMQAGFAPVSVNEAMKVVQAIGGPSAGTGSIGISSTYQQAVSGFKEIAPEISATHAGFGSASGVGTVSQDQLVGSQFIGDHADVRAVEMAKGQRNAAFQGGGGFAGGGQSGGSGVGFGTQ